MYNIYNTTWRAKLICFFFLVYNFLQNYYNIGNFKNMYMWVRSGNEHSLIQLSQEISVFYYIHNKL